MDRVVRQHERRVGLLGYGAIGRQVGEMLRAGQVHGCRLTAVLTRSTPVPERVGTLEQLVSASDIVVEVAGHRPLSDFGPTITSAGVDLLVVSVGALVDDHLLHRLSGAEGHGRVLLSSGAIGGLDILRAAGLLGSLQRVSLESRKRPEVLVEPWMEADLVERLLETSTEVVAFDGTAREAARRFPSSANVAATLGLAGIGLDRTRVCVIGDARTDGPRHLVRAEGEAGTYEISIANRASPTNPRTSAVTPYAVVRALQDLERALVVGV